MTKVILFNGPPGCGKDTAAGIVKELYENVQHVKMADALKDAVCAMFSLTRDQLEQMKPKICEYTRNKVSWREVLINFSEEWAKVLFNEDIFGELALARVDENAKIVVMSDSGFIAEALPFVRAFGPGNTLLVKIQRPGHNFEGDSRSYLNLSAYGVQEVTIKNNDAVGPFYERIDDVVAGFLSRSVLK